MSVQPLSGVKPWKSTWKRLRFIHAEKFGSLTPMQLPKNGIFLSPFH